jgi:hypothetical protein
VLGKERSAETRVFTTGAVHGVRRSMRRVGWAPGSGLQCNHANRGASERGDRWWWPDVYLQPSLRKSKAKHPIKLSVAWGAVEGGSVARDWLQRGWRRRRGRSVRHQLRELQSLHGKAVVLVDDSHVVEWVEWWSGGVVKWWRGGAVVAGQWLHGRMKRGARALQVRCTGSPMHSSPSPPLSSSSRGPR